MLGIISQVRIAPGYHVLGAVSPRSFLLATLSLGIFVLGILSPTTFILEEVTS
jgi:hypothetical protein